jgi:ribokinase
MPSKPIVVIGSINTDLVVTAPRLPHPGETLTATAFATFQGGKGANQAVAAARLGAEVILIGKLGSDAYGATSLRALEAEGIDCSHILTEPGASGLAIITVDATGENTILVLPGTNALVSPSFIASKRDIIASASLVLAQLEIPHDTVLALARLCQQSNVPFILDPAPAQPLPPELLPLTTWFTPNETEAAFYTTHQTLRAQGAQNILLKRGERGALIDQPNQSPIAIAPFPVHAVDTVAAGDTFNGAFAVALTEGQPPAVAARFAAAAAAIAVTRPGAQASMPTLAEVQAALAARP